MICEVHGCPAYIAIVPTPSKREPGRGIPATVFFVFSISSICAQLVKPAAMTMIATLLRTNFIKFTFSGLACSRREQKSLTIGLRHVWHLRVGLRRENGEPIMTDIVKSDDRQVSVYSDRVLMSILRSRKDERTVYTSFDQERDVDRCHDADLSD